MDAIVAALTAQHAELEAVLADLDDAGWTTPSRCPGWTVSDVLLHLAQTDELALASVEGRFAGAFDQFVAGLEPGADVDAGAGAAVDRDRGEPGPVVHERWKTVADRMRSAFAGSEPHQRVQWIVGDLAARTLATTRLAESWVHTEDVTEPLGLESRPGDRLWHIARLAWRTLPHAFAREGEELAGPVAFDLVSPDGSAWPFVEEGTEPVTTVAGPAIDLCQVAGRRLDPSESELTAHGPDAEAVLTLVRTFA